MAGKDRRRPRKAYSLIELVVSIFVVGLLLSSVATALIYCNQYMRTCETKAEAQEEALNTAVWLSRYLQDGNITAMVAQTTASTYAIGISFESVRDPYTAQVVWSPFASGGAVEWAQNIVVYQEKDPTDSSGLSYRVTERSIPNPQTGGNYPLDPPAPIDVATGMTPAAGGFTKVLARNITDLEIEIYHTPNPVGIVDTLPPTTNSVNTVNITIKSYAPYYSMNYGVTVSTAIRPQN